MPSLRATACPPRWSPPGGLLRRVALGCGALLLLLGCLLVVTLFVSREESRTLARTTHSGKVLREVGTTGQLVERVGDGAAGADGAAELARSVRTLSHLVADNPPQRRAATGIAADGTMLIEGRLSPARLGALERRIDRFRDVEERLVTQRRARQRDAERLGLIVDLVAFGGGLAFGFTFDTSGPVVRGRDGVAEEDAARPVPVEDRVAADEPVAAERRAVAPTGDRVVATQDGDYVTPAAPAPEAPPRARPPE
jgi:hypothetical protein